MDGWSRRCIVEGALTSFSLFQNLTSKLKSVCDQIGLLKSLCRKFVKMHLGELIEELTTTDDVRTICVNTGACKWVTRPPSCCTTNNMAYNILIKPSSKILISHDDTSSEINVLSFSTHCTVQEINWVHLLLYLCFTWVFQTPNAYISEYNTPLFRYKAHDQFITHDALL